MCEYCEGISNPISFPRKYTYENGETQTLALGFIIDCENKTLSSFTKDLKTGERFIDFTREIEYCPFCGMSLEKINKIIKDKESYQCSTGKDIVINYCKNIETHDVEYLERALNNLTILEKNGAIENLEGCPTNYGLESYEELCFQTDTEYMSNKEKEKMCDECWRKALE